jgi:hypothetical protein
LYTIAIMDGVMKDAGTATGQPRCYSSALS